ncbi:MAG: response regulator transcription factor [Armatimonadota bacterium]|nr:response regulator transcription factor [Armatimonadota bacterium]MDR7518520.1 response regulator transcription factor [Armatimonadota bacterium]MDR7550434.1 response regulator transcription factor [Armatimonadota bacterium]
MRVRLAVRSPLLREGFRRLLEEDPAIEVVAGEADRTDVEVHLFGIPGEGGLADLRSALDAGPVLAVGPSEPGLVAALHSGARGCLPLGAQPAELRAAVAALAAGEGYIHPSVADAVLTDLRRPRGGPTSQALTEREREILVLLCEGYTNRAIADRLHLSVRTVESHRANLMAKLDADALPDLVFAAIRMGLIES